MKHFLLFIGSLLLILVLACAEDPLQQEVMDPFDELHLPSTLFNYANLDLPSYLTANEFPPQFQFQSLIEYDNTPANNPVSDEGATLGRVLFYDKKLSANGTVACASCHQANHGFSDPNKLSEGFDGQLTRRHSMSIVNATYYPTGRFFWDERAETLEQQVLLPFQDEIEMGLTLEELITIISEQPYYPILFEEAFGDQTITSDRIGKALAQFIRSMVSTTSVYDQARQEVNSPVVDFPSFTSLQNQGKRLFFVPRSLTNGINGNCAGCHQTEAFVGPLPNFPGQLSTFATSNGLDLLSTNDLGVGESTNNPNDNGKFKVPSLKNIGVRAPYMHDGRFTSLEEVVEHYSSGIQNHPNLISPLVNDEGEVGQFNFTAAEKEALVAFLHTLTDTEMLTDEKYSNPFK